MSANMSLLRAVGLVTSHAVKDGAALPAEQGVG